MRQQGPIPGKGLRNNNDNFISENIQGPKVPQNNSTVPTLRQFKLWLAYWSQRQLQR